MSNFLSLLIAIFLVIAASKSFAHNNTGTQQDEKIENLAQSRQWQKLLHLANGEPEIESTAFFLSDTSKANFALTELKYTIAKVTENPILENGFSFKCNYPARTLFLAKHGIIDEFGLSECPQLIEWIGAETFDISIIYADGYLGNPASFYGHLILKFETNDLTGDLFTNSLNFGATVPDQENPVVYIIKGLFGGYKAEYSSNYFYRHNLNYTEVEMRDLWKYRLQLGQYQKELLAAHAWELMRTQYTYFFTSRNCAYHLAKAIEIITPEDILSSKHPFVLPIDVFKSMEKMDNNGMRLVAEPEYIPSRQSKFRHSFNQLSSAQQQSMKGFFASSKSLKDMQLNKDPELLDVMYDYAEFALTQAKSDEELKLSIQKKKRDIQLTRIALPANTEISKVSKPEIDPDIGHKPSLIRFSLGKFDDTEFLDLTIRPAFYDLLSSGGSLLPNSALTMGEVGVRATTHSVELSRIELLKIETFPTGASGLQFDEGLAWNLKVGGERNYLDGLSNSFEWYAQGGAGYAYEVLNTATAYFTLNGRISSPNELDSNVFIMPSIGLLGSLFEQKTHCELSYIYDVNLHNERSRRKIQCGASFLQSETKDIRVSLSSHFETQALVGFSWYW